MSRRSPRLSLRSLLIGINLVVLVLPLAGIQVMRLYESALVRQTESALIAQAAFVAAFYRSMVIEQGTQDWLGMSRPLATIPGEDPAPQWSPQPPILDLTSSPTLPPFPDGQQDNTAESFAQKAGERLIPVLKDAQLVTLAGIRVVDPWGVIIASTGDDIGLSIAHAEEVASALNGEPASRIRTKSDPVTTTTFDSVSRTSAIRIFVSAPIILHGRLIGAVMLSRTPPSIVQALYGKRWLLLQGLALLVGLVVLMSLLTFRLIAQPISRLANQASAIARGKMDAQQATAEAQASPARTKELHRLQDAITEMATTLEQRANYLEEFSRHVSHEFKTPIAGIRGAIEVLQDHAQDMSDTQRERFLANIAADAHRMHRLTERLMQLTKAEMDSLATERVHLASLVEEAASSFTQRVTFRSDRVDLQHYVFGQTAAIRAVLETLFENAIQHGASEINVWSEVDAKRAFIFVQDNGHGISASNREQIFTPFFTTKREDGGTGLGLTIAQALVKHLGGVLTLLDRPGPTTFRLRLPPAN